MDHALKGAPERVPDCFRGPPDPEQQLTTQQPRSAVKLTHPFADARGLKAYASSSPVTRALGKKSSITRRWVKNNSLFSAVNGSPGAKAHYRRSRDEH